MDLAKENRRLARKPELLVPAGSLEVLRVAVRFGADAVYIGGDAFGLRAKA
jgi:putative protease